MALYRYSFNTPAKIMGCIHAALGGLLFVMGIVARIQVHHWTSIMLIGIWTGILIMSTGAIGVVGAYRRLEVKQKRCYIITFVVMSIISLLLAILVVVCYAMAVRSFFDGENIGDFPWYKWDDEPDFKLQNQNRARGVTAVILILGLLELMNALFSVIHGLMCCCLRKWHQLKHQELKHRNSAYSEQ